MCMSHNRTIQPQNSKKCVTAVTMTEFDERSPIQLKEVTCPSIPRKPPIRRPPQASRLRIHRGDHSWVARGHNAVAPKPSSSDRERIYFPTLSARYKELMLDSSPASSPNNRPPRIVSVCIPCFNEEADALKRTIDSLHKQKLPRGIVIEIVVAMDGTGQISRSMGEYLQRMFGINVFDTDARKNPFITFPSAQTVIVEQTSDPGNINNTADLFRKKKAAMSLSLVIKRTNKRKVNSQRWWLYAHAKDTQCEFAFATDCGIVFDSKCLALLLDRMDREPGLSGLTGYQRVMPAQMQGDGNFEFFSDPWGFFLRNIQSYDFEMSQSTTKSLVDSVGFIPVLPGPCSLFRYKDFASIADNYFSFTTQPLRGDGSDIVLGNVQLAEDRFPPVLLTFREDDKADDGDEKPGCGGSGDEEKTHNTSTDSNSEEKTHNTSTGSNSGDSGSHDLHKDTKSKVAAAFSGVGDMWRRWRKEKGFRHRPHTGFVRDAVFYFEAEKPLGQLVKQRRRWINGAYMAGFWVLKEGWIFKAKRQGFITKAGAWAVLFFEIMQGMIIRLIIPATIACGLMFMVTMIPSIYHENADEIRDILNDKFPGGVLLLSGIGAATFYLATFAVFMIAHTPKAVPTQTAEGDILYHIDPKSAYRPWLFFISFMVNAVTAAMFFYVGIGVYRFVGWNDAPMYFKVLTVMIGFPYLVAFLDGIVNSKRPSLRAFVNLIFLTPLFMLSSLWFYVWFPCYASARMSDLSWGNRAAHEEYHANSDIARHRAYLGRVISVSIIVTNVVACAIILGVVEALFSEFLTIVLFSLLGFNVLLHVLNVLDIICRFFWIRLPRWLCGEPPAPLDLPDNHIMVDDDSEDESIPYEMSMDYTLDHYTIEMSTQGFHLPEKSSGSARWPYGNAFFNSTDDDPEGTSKAASSVSKRSPIGMFGRDRKHRASSASVKKEKPPLSKSASHMRRDNHVELENADITIQRNLEKRDIDGPASNMTSIEPPPLLSLLTEVDVFEEDGIDSASSLVATATSVGLECALNHYDKVQTRSVTSMPTPRTGGNHCDKVQTRSVTSTPRMVRGRGGGGKRGEEMPSVVILSST